MLCIEESSYTSPYHIISIIPTVIKQYYQTAGNHENVPIIVTRYNMIWCGTICDFHRSFLSDTLGIIFILLLFFLHCWCITWKYIRSNRIDEINKSNLGALYWTDSYYIKLNHIIHLITSTCQSSSPLLLMMHVKSGPTPITDNPHTLFTGNIICRKEP